MSELRVFHVDAATGFTPVGALSMTDVYQAVSYYQGLDVYCARRAPQRHGG